MTRRLEARVAALETMLLALRRQVDELHAERRDADAELLEAVAAVTSGAVFSPRELHEARAVDRELRDALEGLTTPQQIGIRLAKIARAGVLRGLLLRQLPRDNAGCNYVVELHADP